MKPEEAIERLHQFLQQSIGIIEDADRGDDYAVKVKEDAEKDLSSIQLAIKALEEIQQYREIGTVEECKELASMVTTEKKNVLGQIVDEWKEYIEIGTLEECRKAVEKQRTKKIIIRNWNPTRCPACDYKLSTSLGDGYYKHPTFLERCPNCGQAISWEESEE